MNKNGNKSYEQSTNANTSTKAMAGNDVVDQLDNIKYLNLDFKDHSETSSQLKEPLAGDYNPRSPQQAPDVRSNKPPPSKILPMLNFTKAMLGGEMLRPPEPEPALKEKTLVEMGFKPNEIEGWENIVQPAKNNLYKLLKNMIDNHIKPNVQIRIGGVTFNCHMMVLQCYSEFFLECNNEVLIQLPEEKITPGAFMMVYDWMLAEEPLVQREGILELFNAANFLRIKDLINQCWLCLDDDVRFREDTAFLLYLEARTYGLDSLEELMLTRICRFFLTLVASKEFLELKAKEICTLLSSNSLGVNSEIEIFMSVARWLSYDWENREQHLLKVARCVRFSLMPPWFLVTLNKATECDEIDRIVSHPEVKKMISDGISFTTTQLYYGENRDEFLHFLERYHLVSPMSRQWIFDKECHYHHRLDCPNMQYITYKAFIEYLEMIQAIGKNYWQTLEMAKSTDRSFLQCCGARADLRKQLNEKNGLYQFVRKVSRDQGIQVDTARNAAAQVPLSICEAQVLAAENELHLRRAVITKSTANSTEMPPPTKNDAALKSRHEKMNGNAVPGQRESSTSTTGTSGEYSIDQLEQAWQQQMERRRRGHPAARQSARKSCLKPSADGVKGKRLSGGQAKRQQVPPLVPNGIVVDRLKPKLKNVSLGPLPEAEVAERINGGGGDLKKVRGKKLLIFGGMDPYSVQLSNNSNNNNINSINELVTRGDQVLYYDDVSYNWRHLSQIPSGTRHHHVAVRCNGLIYIAGGTRTALGCVFEKSICCFDPATLKWSVECSLPEVRRDFAAIAIDGDSGGGGGGGDRGGGDAGRHLGGLGTGFFIIGGEGVDGRALSSVWFYDVLRKSWAKKPPLNVGRYGFAATLVHNEIWIAGGIINYTINSRRGTTATTPSTGGRGGETALRSTDSDASEDETAAAATAGAGTSAGAANGGKAGRRTTSSTADVITDTLEYYTLKCEGRPTGAASPLAGSPPPPTTMAATKTTALAAAAVNGGGGPFCGACEAEGCGRWIKAKLYLRVPRLFGRFCYLPAAPARLFLVGGIGFGENDTLTSLDSVEAFDFAAAQWQPSGAIRWARHGHSVAALDEHTIVIVGGVSTRQHRTLTTVEQFSARTRTSLPELPPLPWPLSSGALVILD